MNKCCFFWLDEVLKSKLKNHGLVVKKRKNHGFAGRNYEDCGGGFRTEFVRPISLTNKRLYFFFGFFFIRFIFHWKERRELKTTTGLSQQQKRKESDGLIIWFRASCVTGMINKKKALSFWKVYMSGGSFFLPVRISKDRRKLDLRKKGRVGMHVCVCFWTGFRKN